MTHNDHGEQERFRWDKDWWHKPAHSCCLRLTFLGSSRWGHPGYRIRDQWRCVACSGLSPWSSTTSASRTRCPRTETAPVQAFTGAPIEVRQLTIAIVILAYILHISGVFSGTLLISHTEKTTTKNTLKGVRPNCIPWNSRTTPFWSLIKVSNCNTLQGHFLWIHYR